MSGDAVTGIDESIEVQGAVHTLMTEGTAKNLIVDFLPSDSTVFVTYTDVVLDSILNGYVLHQIPEPSTFALLGVGVVGLLGFGLRRRESSRA